MTHDESDEHGEQDSTDKQSSLIDMSRRGFLGALGAGAAGTALGVGGARAEESITGGGTGRLEEAYDLRVDAADDLLDATTGGTGTYERFDKLHGTYTKALPHNEVGEVDKDAYQKMDDALDTADLDAYNDIPLAKDRGLANPIAAQAFNLTGADGHEKAMPEAPAIGSDQGAAEMVELYWRALLRDVPFANYGENDLAQEAYDELTSLDGYEGPSGKGPQQDLLRGVVPGARKGPYITQFLLKDIKNGAITIKNTLKPQKEGVDYMTDRESWINVRRGDGDVVGTDEFEDEERRITTGRDLATYVHFNTPSEMAVNASYDLLARGVPLDENIRNLNARTQNVFVEFGPPAVNTLVAGVVDNMKQATWYHKWLVHRRARPEKYGGLVEIGQRDEFERGYPSFLNPDLRTSKAVKETEKKFGTAFLPQAYPEGSPTHPSYPAGHSTFIGASVTVLKALFDTDHVLEDPVRVNEDGELEPISETLTVRGELNKLATNNAYGRDFAGIHYRTDGLEGFKLGEKVAAEYLVDELRATAVDVTLTFESFTGETVRVSQDGVER